MNLEEMSAHELENYMDYLEEYEPESEEINEVFTALARKNCEEGRHRWATSVAALGVSAYCMECGIRAEQ